MDVRMPRLDGLEATRRLQARDPARPRIIVVTAFEHNHYVYDALASGASGFLLKRSTAEELLQGIRVVAAGRSVPFPSACAESSGTRSRRSIRPSPHEWPASPRVNARSSSSSRAAAATRESPTSSSSSPRPSRRTSPPC